MAKATNSQGLQTPTATMTAGGEDRQDAQRRHRVEAVIWIVAVLAFIASAFVIHAHPTPYAFDLAATYAAQANTPFSNGINPILNIPSVVNNPTSAGIALAVWLVFMVLVSLILRLRGKGTAALSWLQAAIFLVLAVMSSAGLNVLLDIIIGRPRPNPKVYHFQLHTPLVPFPTYPSGHTEHDVVYYGFLLYLSFTRPVREWRYHWLLLPLQIYAVFDILAIGYSRVFEGDHWLTDVLGGYLEGAIYLAFFIFLYRWTTDFLARRRAKRHEQHAQAHTALY